MSEKHFILEMIDLFPDGYTIDVSQNKSEKDDSMSVIITGKDIDVPFRITGPAASITSEAIAGQIDSLKESMKTIRNNKDSWIEFVKEKIEEEAEKEAKKKAASKSSSSKTKTPKKTKTEQEKEEVAKEYANVLNQDPDKSMSVDAMKKAIKNAKAQTSMFDSENQQEKAPESKKDNDLKQARDDFENKSDSPKDLGEREETKPAEGLPKIPGSESANISGNSAPEGQPITEDKEKTSEQSDNDENDGSSVLDLGTWD